MKAYRFTDLPRKTTADRYQAVLERLKSSFGSWGGLRGFYTWGSITNLGISDLDVFVVVRQDAGLLPLRLRSYHFFPKDMKYVLSHPLMIGTGETVLKLSYLNPKIQLNLEAGEKDVPCSLSDKEREAVEIAMLNDLLIRNFPRDAISLLSSRVIPARMALLRLNSLSYSLKTCARLGMKKSWRDLMQDISSLREGWFDDVNSNLRKLGGVIERSLDASADMVEFFDKFSDKRKRVSLSVGKEGLRYTGDKNHTRFVEDWDRDTLDRRYGKEIMLPLSLAAQLCIYAKGDGPISSHIRHHLRGSVRYVRCIDSRILTERMRLLDGQARISEEIRSVHFPAFIDYGYRTRSGILNQLQNAIYSLKRLP